jgi:2-(1,2-epoxy-1,2-dihydrophenyl)acetyl-CoA isomerase
MTYKTILLEIINSVAVLKFNRPQTLNGLTSEVLSEIDAVLDVILTPDSGVRCLLLTGEGRGFSSGADLASGTAAGASASTKIDAGRVLETHFNPLLERLMKMPIPFVTAVNGPAAGAGCSFAIAGDIVIAARSAYFLQAFVNIGLVPDVGSTWMLPRLIGKARAQAMMMLGEKVPAETALQWGMVYKVVDDADLMNTAMDVATKLAKGPTQAIGMIRREVRASYENTLTQQLRLEREDQLTAGQTNDFLEGVSAFLQKRPATFTGS